MPKQRHSEETRQKIFAMWDLGDSAGDISKRTGISRNAIIGIVNRSGRRRGADFAYKRLSVARASGAIRAPKKVMPEKVVISDAGPEPIGPVGDFPAYGKCQYMRGPVSQGFQMCGHPGKPWCDYHKTVVFACQSQTK